MSPNDPSPPHRPLIEPRSMLILLLGVLTGISAGGLTYLGGQPWPISVLAGGAAAAAAVRFFDTFVS